MPGDPRLGRLLGGPDREPSAVRHRLEGVVGELENHLLELAGVDAHPSHLVAQDQLESDVLAQVPLQGLLERQDGLVHVEHLWLKHLLATEREQTPRHRGCAVSGLLDAFGVATKRALGLEPAQQQLGEASDRDHRVVEVVSDAARETADRFHLLGPIELELEPLVLRDVGDQRDGTAVRAVGGGQRARADKRVDRPTVGADELALELDALASSKLLDVRSRGGMNFWCRVVESRRADEVLDRKTEDVGHPRVREGRHEVRADDPDAFGCGLDDQPVSLFALAQRLLDCLSVLKLPLVEVESHELNVVAEAPFPDPLHRKAGSPIWSSSAPEVGLAAAAEKRRQ